VIIFGLLLGSTSPVGRNRTGHQSAAPFNSRARSNSDVMTLPLNRTFQCSDRRAGFSYRTKSARRRFTTPRGEAKAWRSTTQVCGADRGGWPRRVARDGRAGARSHDLARKGLRY
jgi:hypothetical protein